MNTRGEGAFFGGDYEATAEVVLGQRTETDITDLETYIQGLDVDAPRILDAACGFGRISVPLLDRGLDVTGIDLSPELVSAAKLRATEAGHDPGRFVNGDLTEENSGMDKFDCIICWHHSIGLGSAEADHAIIRNLLGKLSAKGHLLIQTLNLWAVIRHLSSGGRATFEAEKKGLRVIDEVTFVPGNSTLVTRRYAKRGENTATSQMTARIYAPSEIKTMIQLNGGEVAAFRGDRIFDEFGLESTNLTLIARANSFIPAQETARYG